MLDGVVAVPSLGPLKIDQARGTPLKASIERCIIGEGRTKRHSGHSKRHSLNKKQKNKTFANQLASNLRGVFFLHIQCKRFTSAVLHAWFSG